MKPPPPRRKPRTWNAWAVVRRDGSLIDVFPGHGGKWIGATEIRVRVVEVLPKRSRR